jgi:hypothetical protein
MGRQKMYIKTAILFAVIGLAGMPAGKDRINLAAASVSTEAVTGQAISTASKETVFYFTLNLNPYRI